ncbi:replication-associated recombination protein A [Mycoplasma sp. OR1901]|uniref:replication-associated recombination protein A n=1 Tax=Mycoplasma sp. OR1901 TaxID=2742195 RepID=UPI0015842405|nr:replication-associated recombination protein A [Mycoplasma sp. OR1901]QKT05452.1 replication-associated recombination protein A [Mycoplasma sp. OR1901]
MNNNLANKLRPENFDDLVGQKNIVDLLKKVSKNKMTSSFIFFGESGVGKTTMALILAKNMGLNYEYFNASIDDKSKLVKILKDNQIIIIDEIHRLNKDKQDILLSYLEFDKVIVYATTTENPYFKVNPALRSRMQILELHKIDENEIVEYIKKLIAKGKIKLNISDEVLLSLSRFSSGDLRLCLNNIQLISLVIGSEKEITTEDLKKVIPNINFYSDSNSNEHFNNLSAFHKSLRGSDIDASLYYGMLILKTGDENGLFRRMLCVAYEDIGMANPNVGYRVEAAIRTYERLGMPEGRLAIGAAIVDLANSPKSNSTYLALSKAIELIDSGKIYPIPKHLKDRHYKSAAKLGYGIDYKYPHDYENNWVEQNYLPQKLKDIKIFEYGNSKFEQDSKKYWEKIKKG